MRSASNGLRWWLLQWLALLLGCVLRSAAVEEYVKVISGRCLEFQGVTPFGAEGKNWTSDMDERARAWCNRRSWCVGYMRFMAEEPEEHCNVWCGRPQFCRQASLVHNDDWVAYVHKGPLMEVQRESIEKEARSKPNGDDGDDEAEGAMSLEPGWSKPQEISCQYPYDGLVKLWSEEPPEAETEKLLEGQNEDDCRVLHHQQGRPLPRDWSSRFSDEAPRPFFHGVLSETEEMVPFFSADTAVQPWIYSFESTEYIGETVVGGSTILGPKRHYLSIFYTSPDAACDGKNKSQWTPDEAELALPGHVYVDDGNIETRRNAFISYHFAVICMGPEDRDLVHQAAVDAIGFGTHPLVPSHLHKQLHRAFFHLPDAIQPYLRIHPLILEAYLEELYTNPEKNEAMYYKQTFLFLMMELLRYRYRQGQQQRLRNAACALCTDQRRLRRLASVHAEAEALAGSEQPAAGGVGSAALVATVFCVMSRRSGAALRSAIRETWGSVLTGDSVVRFFVGKEVDGDDSVVEDLDAGDVVELDAPEAYKAVTLKAFSMLHWARHAFPNLRFLVRADDDVYLRPGPLLAQLQRRPLVGYLWGNFDSGSSVIRDPTHPHYNSLQQLPERRHPMFGDIFPPYVRGHLWAMSNDLLAFMTDVWAEQLTSAEGNISLDLASHLPHPDDPAIGVAMASLVDSGHISLAVDDRDLNHFSLNPACNATYLNIHNRTWVVHHVNPEAMRCFWALDVAAMELESGMGQAGHKTYDELPDLCPCSMDVVEEKSGNEDDDLFDYPRDRFNE